MHPALQFDSVRTVHFDINQRRIPALLREPGERVASVFGRRYVIAFFAEPFAQRVAHAQFVVDDQQFSLGTHFNHLTFRVAVPPPVAVSAASGAWLGRVTVKVVPRPSCDWTSMRPLCRSTMPRLIANPSPTPCPLSLVVIKGSKIFGNTSG